MGWGLKKKLKKLKKKAKKLAKKAVPVVAQAAGTYFGGPVGGALAGAAGNALVGNDTGGLKGIAGNAAAGYLGGGGAGGNLASSFMPQGGGGGGMPDWMNQIAGSFGGGEDGGVDWGDLAGGAFQGYQQMFGGQGGPGAPGNPIQGIVPGMIGGQGGGGGMPGGISPQYAALLAGAGAFAPGNNKLPDQPNWMELAKMTADSERNAYDRASFESHSGASNSQGSMEWVPEKTINPVTGAPMMKWKQVTTLDPTLKATQDAQRGGDRMRMEAANNMLPGALAPMSTPMDYSQFGGMQSLQGNTGYDTGGAPPGMMNGGSMPGPGGGLTNGAFGTNRPPPAPMVQPQSSPLVPAPAPRSTAPRPAAAPAPRPAAAPAPRPAAAPAPRPAPAAPPRVSDAERIRRQLAGFTH